MAKNGFGLHRQSIVAFDESSHRRSRNRQHTRARASQQTVKQSAATQRSVTADCELRVSSWSVYGANWICPLKLAIIFWSQPSGSSGTTQHHVPFPCKPARSSIPWSITRHTGNAPGTAEKSPLLVQTKVPHFSET